jgi:hypothetical protein
MEELKSVLNTIVKGYFGIAFIHLLVIQISNSNGATLKHIRGKGKKEIKKGALRPWLAFGWPVLWIRILRDLKPKNEDVQG